VPLASAVNVASGRNRAGSAIIALGISTSLSAYYDPPPGSGAATHLVLDVYGYFY
jgi:hypothetical protein